MAGRELGIMVTAFALFSSTLSGFGFVGGPGLVYSQGMTSVWMIVCGTVAICFTFFLVAKRLRIFSEVYQTVSLPDTVALRYQSELTRFLTAVAIILGVVGYLAAQIMAMAVVLQEILNGVDGIPEVSLGGAMAISVAVLVFYCVTGGIIAGVYTDVVQGAVMAAAGVLVLIAAIQAVDGGVAGGVTTMMNDDPEAIGPWGTLGIMGGAVLLPPLRRGRVRAAARHHQADDEQAHPRLQTDHLGQHDRRRPRCHAVDRDRLRDAGAGRGRRSHRARASRRRGLRLPAGVRPSHPRRRRLRGALRRHHVDRRRVPEHRRRRDHPRHSQGALRQAVEKGAVLGSHGDSRHSGRRGALRALLEGGPGRAAGHLRLGDIRRRAGADRGDRLQLETRRRQWQRTLRSSPASP